MLDKIYRFCQKISLSQIQATLISKDNVQIVTIQHTAEMHSMITFFLLLLLGGADLTEYDNGDEWNFIELKLQNYTGASFWIP